MYEFFRPYVIIMKMVGGIAIITVIAGYVGWLHWTISSHEEQIQFLEATVHQCDVDRSKLRLMNQHMSHTMDVWESYYRERGCLDLREGELTEEDTRLKLR